MNVILAISITINIAIIVMVTYYIKKHNLLRLKKANSANIEYEAIFKSIFECAPYSIVIQRIDNGACVAANHAFYKSMGITENDLKNFNMANMLNMSHEEAAYARKHVAESGGVYAQEAVIQKNRRH